MSNVRFSVCTVAAYLFLVCARPAAAWDDKNLAHVGDIELGPISEIHELPARMYLPVDFTLTPDTHEADQRNLKLFVKVIEGDYDDELKADAAAALYKVVTFHITDHSIYHDALKKLAAENESPKVRRHAVMALLEIADVDDAEFLAELCVDSDPGLTIEIEKRLADWKSTVLQDRWRQRVKDPTSYSRQYIATACRGLQSLADQDAADDLRAIVASDQNAFAARTAAARAASGMVATGNNDLAARLARGSLQDRILAVTLVQQGNNETGLSLLEGLARDPSNIVSSQAFEHLLKLAPKRLEALVDVGLDHPDSNVQKSIIRFLEQYPSAEYAAHLHDLMADQHAGVRNAARAALARVARKEGDLLQQIHAAAGAELSGPGPWELIEQSMLLLGDLRVDDYQAAAIPLLTHERFEVLVTAGWLLHLMPQKALGDDMESMARERWKQIAYRSARPSGSAARRPQRVQGTRPSEEYLEALREERRRMATASGIATVGPNGLTTQQHAAYSRQLCFLFQALGYAEQESTRDLCEEMLDKEAPTLDDTRAAGIFALALLSQNMDDRSRTKQSTRRILAQHMLDDDPPVPEVTAVRCTAALGLGLLGLKSSVRELQMASNEFGEDEGVFSACNIALVRLGSEPLEKSVRVPRPLGPWALGPLD